MIRCNFKKLHLTREAREGRRITLREIQRETGIATSSLSKLANNDVTRFDADTLSRLCDFFKCTVCDLLEYIPDEGVSK
jgi:putative transcriptional regulator